MSCIARTALDRSVIVLPSFNNAFLGFIIELFLTFDDELIKYRDTYTEVEAKRSSIIKDYLRDNFVKELIKVLNQVFNNLDEFQGNKKFISNCTKVISQLIDWNNLELFIESIYITLKFLNNEDFQADALLVLNAIVNKGMDVINKLEAIKLFDLLNIIDNLFKIKNLNESTLFNLCDIVNNLGVFVFHSLNMLQEKNQNSSEIYVIYLILI
jgi:hypothetical protein